MLKTYLKRPKFSQNLQKRSHSLVDPYKPITTTKLSSHPSNNQTLLTQHLQPVKTTLKNVQPITSKTQSGLNHKFLEGRRQNFLNTGYNNRKQRLQSITTENKQIHCRINSQKSAYSRDQMKKSYEHNMNISRRLSQSKTSKRSSSSSRVSMRSTSSRQSTNRNNQNKFLKARALPKKYQLNTKNVTTLQKQDLKKMGKIFSFCSFENQNKKPYSSNHRRNSQKPASIPKKQTLNPSFL